MKVYHAVIQEQSVGIQVINDAICDTFLGAETWVSQKIKLQSIPWVHPKEGEWVSYGRMNDVQFMVTIRERLVRQLNPNSKLTT
jgi:hypothetical protein